MCSKQHKKDGCNSSNQKKEGKPSSDKRHPKKSKEAARIEKLLDEFQPLSEEQLAQLTSNGDIQEIMKNKKFVERLRQIDSASNRVDALEKSMQDPSFLEFCDIVLDTINNNSSSGDESES